MNRNYKNKVDYNYEAQQKAIKEICKELGLVAFYPSYHADKTDKNTVIIYTKEGNEYNKSLSKYASVDEEQGRICTFENSNINGFFDTSYMNHGQIKLNHLGDVKEVLKAYVEQAMRNTKSDFIVTECAKYLNDSETTYYIGCSDELVTRFLTKEEIEACIAEHDDGVLVSGELQLTVPTGTHVCKEEDWSEQATLCIAAWMEAPGALSIDGHKELMLGSDISLESLERAVQRYEQEKEQDFTLE